MSKVSDNLRAEQTDVLIFCGVFHTGYRETVRRRVAGMPPGFWRFFAAMHPEEAAGGRCHPDDAKNSGRMCTRVNGRCQQKLTTRGTAEVCRHTSVPAGNPAGAYRNVKGHIYGYGR